MLSKRWKACRRFLTAAPVRSVILVGLLAFGVSAFLSWLRPPLPRVHDEFSYLLAADTFAGGRLSRPTHPLWRYFETFHVLHEPSYASKYPPVQGLFLALGMRCTGAPIVGTWISVALGCAGVCWMLQGWTRPRWALLGGVFAALHHGIHGGISGWGTCYSWSQSYWGGGPAMLGGALVLGAYARWRRRATLRAGLILGLGVAILANTRPFEGMLVCLPILATLLSRVLRSSRDTIAAAAAMSVLGVAGVLMAHHNVAVTGSASTLPYSRYEATYNPAPIFAAFHSPKPPPAYHHEVLKRFFVDWCTEQVQRQKTLGGWWRYHRERMGWLKAFFVGPLILPLLVLAWTLRSRSNLVAFVLITLVVGAHFFTVGIQPHYTAPVACCFFLLVVEGMRRLATITIQGHRFGKLLNIQICLLVVLNLIMVGSALRSEVAGWEASRAAMQASLVARGGKHVVVVSYKGEHNLLHEWVANRADIDGAEVVWAREMEEMRPLLRYFVDRSVWVVDADAEVPCLKVYRSLSPVTSSRKSRGASP